MRRIVVALTLALFLLAMFGGPAFARSDRACVGAFVSELAHQGGVGSTVREEAKLFHPLGKTIVSPFATTCEPPAE